MFGSNKHLIAAAAIGAVALMAGSAQAGSNRLQPGPHEIRLDGIILSVDAAKHRVVLDVGSFTLPNGRSKPLAQYTRKLVLLSNDTSVHRRGDLTAPLRLNELKPGLVAVVIGRDLGQGQPLPLREMLVWAPVAATAPDPTPAPSVDADA